MLLVIDLSIPFYLVYYLQVLRLKLYLPSKVEIQAGLTIQSDKNPNSFLLYALFVTLQPDFKKGQC